MTYSNVVFSYGAEDFLSACSRLIDGLILPDLPFDEKEEFLPVCQKYGIDLISSHDRIAKIERIFLYIVSSDQNEIQTDLKAIVDIVRQHTSIPCSVLAFR